MSSRFDRLSSVFESKPGILYTTDGSRFRATWRVLVPLLVATPLYFAANVFGPLPLQILVDTELEGTAAIVANLGALLLITAGIALATAVAFRLVSWLDRQRAFRGSVEYSSAWVRDFLGGVLIGAVATVVAMVYLGARGHLTLETGYYGVGIESVPLAVAALAAGSLFYLANNAFEEVVFREIALRHTARGIRSRGASVWVAVGAALLISTVLFGAFHFPMHGIGGLITSGAGGILFGVAYLLTGRLAMPVGVHFGGLAFVAIMREELAGFIFPTLLRATPEFAPAEGVSFGLEMWAVRIVVGAGLLLAWVYYWHGRVGIPERVYRLERE
ncbi:CPBP family intramembrane glutamic endopeptidase [Natrarchaeobius chitinivorans]|uniref:CPBP family intramembrane metalloprotease n=1 Tax=Natrarchaeobius chitinivorans TaxID=1679083 RepID=A0A3N6MBF6_NATCH|nr:CPBP family intramembrane glutamic endopeptidase [Natrarchaeobius chitinivorans]RQG98014.1 CPBP family intramembrane metalloprotease [Natrarchaeobius chitinivorans]